MRLLLVLVLFVVTGSAFPPTPTAVSLISPVACGFTVSVTVTALDTAIVPRLAMIGLPTVVTKLLPDNGLIEPN